MAERGVFALILVLLVVWSLRASPLRFSSQMLRIAPFCYFAIPLLQTVLEGSHAWLEADNRLVNLLLLAVAACLWVVRRQFRKRIRQAEPHPLWVATSPRGIPSILPTPSGKPVRRPRIRPDNADACTKKGRIFRPFFVSASETVGGLQAQAVGAVFKLGAVA